VVTRLVNIEKANWKITIDSEFSPWKNGGSSIVMLNYQKVISWVSKVKWMN